MPRAKQIRPTRSAVRKVKAEAAGLPPNPLAYGSQPFFSGTGYGASGAAWHTNATKGWPTKPGSPDSDIVLNLDLLRSRSRELYMGNPLAAAVINTLRTYVVGTGIKPLPKINGKLLKMSDKEANDFDEAWRLEWDLWASSPSCDWYRRLNFYQQQDLCVVNMLMNGDSPVLLPYMERPGCPYALSLRMIEADRLQNPLYWNFRRNILGGVELDDQSQVISYHIRQVHPHQTFWPSDIVKKLFEWVEVQAFGELTGRPNVLLVHEPERVEQRRGVPLIAKVIEILKQWDRFVKSEVAAAEMTARFIANVKSQFPNADFLQQLDEKDRKDVCSIGRYDITIEDANKVNFLRPGDTMEFLHSVRPNGLFDPFNTAIAKLVGAATGVPFEILISNFSSSYSASRAAFLLFEKRVNTLRNILVTLFCQPIYEELMCEAVEKGIIKAPGFFDDLRIRAAYCRCEWIGQPMGCIEPLQEINASKEKVIIGASTVEREAQELTGTNYRDNIAQQKQELKEFHDAGLSYPGFETPITRTQRIQDIVDSSQPGGAAKKSLDPAKAPEPQP